MTHIYSDESGSYGGTGDTAYYVRSFVFVDESEVRSIDASLETILAIIRGKRREEIKEIKAEDVLKDYCKETTLKIFDQLNFQFIACFTRLDIFQITEYNIYRDLTYMLGHHDAWTISEQEKEKMLHRLRVYLFQKNFESYYFKRLYAVLASPYVERYNLSAYKLLCDKFADQSGALEGELQQRNIAQNIYQEKSENCRGVQLADIVAGVIRRMLEDKTGKAEATKFFCDERFSKHILEGDKRYTKNESNKFISSIYAMTKDHHKMENIKIQPQQKLFLVPNSLLL